MIKLNYILSCSAKFHHFEIGKVLHKKGQLDKIICGYPWFKLKYENIPKHFILANGFYNILKYPLRGNYKFKKITDFLSIKNKINIDNITCDYIDNNKKANVLMALAGVSLHSGKKFKSNENIFICERSSSHIVFQNDIMLEEYKEFTKKNYRETNPWNIENELKEYEDADIILVPSNYAKSTFKNDLLKKVKVLEFGSNIDMFYKDKEISKSDKFFDVLFIGSKSLRKGLHYLIDAFHKFKHPYKRLHIIGSDTEDKEFFVDKLNDDKILVYGHVKQSKLNSIINKCHVFVLPSIDEGFGIVTLQALAAGCPIIVSENTGPVDIVKKNKCGYVVPIRNSNEITHKLQSLADDRVLLKSFSYNAANYAKNNTWDDYVDKLNNLILDFKQK